MYKPYTVKKLLYSTLAYEDTDLRVYGLFGYGAAKRDAESMNTAFALGFQKALTFMNKEKGGTLLKEFMSN